MRDFEEQYACRIRSACLLIFNLTMIFAVCGFETIIPKDSDEDGNIVKRAFPIVGFDHLGHGKKDPEVTRLKKNDPDADGLLVKLTGGEYRETPKSEPKETAAVIEFQCDPDRTGLEGLEDVAETEDDGEEKRRRDKGDEDEDEDDTDKENAGRSLKFRSFKLVDDTYILRLDWRTKYACENYVRDNPKSGGHWGFFTWIIIM